MSALFKKYADLKVRFGGNREKKRWEYTFGTPIEERQQITPLPRYIVRIMAETEFAIRLSETLGGRYDSLIEKELDYLTTYTDENGTITKSAAEDAETMLLPLSADAKEYKLILAGHAHIDMNWMWSWQETVAATIATFTTMLKIMDEYPEFCFSQSQTSVYKLIDDYAPELHDKIKARIDEGRWEITSSAWVETDKNMPNTESLLRHLEYSRTYLHDKWGIDPDSLEIDFSPDTFGHSANIPEIDTYSGVKYYYHCRALDADYNLYRWRSPSGKEMLNCREPYWYNSGITTDAAMGLFEISRRNAGLKTGLVVYGVGDHGGGPTRRDIERGIEMQGWPVFPTIKFGTLREFFCEAESVRDKLPIWNGEINFEFPGCYTTQSRIKRGNRRSEAALAEMEAITAFAHTRAGYRIRSAAVEEAWQKVLFTHFHDILTGSCVQDSREHAMGLYQEVLAAANSEIGFAVSAISDMIDTSSVKAASNADSQSEGAGVGYNISRFDGRAMPERGGGITRLWNVFNNTYADKEEPVEITVWDWQGDLRYVKITDGDGNPLEFQLVDGSMQTYWDHMFFRVLVYLKVPAMSYMTVVLSERETETYPAYIREDRELAYADRNYILENDRIRCEFDYSTGEMISMKDKSNGREYIADVKRASLVYVDTQARNSNAWMIGTYLSKTPITDITNISWSSNGSLRHGFRFDAKIRSSKVTVEYTLDKGAPFVRMNIHADWLEHGGEKIPVLVYDIPLSVETDKFVYNIPGGCIVRDAAEIDRPGLSYIAAVEEGVSSYAGIVTDSKYGFRGVVRDGCALITSTLINSSVNPDPYPELGVHDISLAIGLLPADPAEREYTAQNSYKTMTAISTTSHTGTFPMSASFMKIDARGAVVSAVIPDNDGISVRLYSVSDAEEDVKIDAKLPVKSAYLADLFGRKIADCESDGSAVRTKIPAYSVITVKIEM